MSDTPTPKAGAVTPEPVVDTPSGEERGRASKILREIANGSALISVLSVLIALVVGAILIAATDERVEETALYFFSRPGDMLSAIWQSVSGAYTALFQGAIFNFRREGFENQIKPIFETLNFATPLIAAGLGVGLAFRVGMFNIGARGQILVAIAAAGWVGFSLDLPPVIHAIVALIAGIAAGSIWGGIVGLLKAKTGAHEVIMTIMLNFVALNLVAFLLRTPGALQAAGSNNPKSPPMKETAIFADLIGPQYSLHVGFLLVIAATVAVWWLLNRSTLGFAFRAVGENPHAARTAGINVNMVYILAMVIAGALAGLAGANQVLGTVTSGITIGLEAGIGFEAITVALLGRSRPWGIFAAGILFGAFKAGGYSMQAAEGVPIDIITIVQSLIVLFIAAPPLVRAIFRIPAPGAKPRVRAIKEAAK